MPLPNDVSRSLAVIVMGVSGSGKSTLGVALAGRLGCRFLEGDDFHTEAARAQMAAGHPLTDADRWPWLDRLAAAVNAAAVADGCVVAACSALRRAYRERIEAGVRARVRFVLLDASREELHRRLEARQHHYMPASLLDSQLATLERPDDDEPALTLPIGGDPAALTQASLAWLAGQMAA